ncbi:protein RGF1 INDUCIBLE TRANSCRIPTION FACTOR 1-like isoform X1 [Malus sylvestris]|nr:uncharacterized protein LOC103448030 [Malus domestica]XP_050109669.1 protein RGF1 INDUCIBLE TRANSCRIPTION FACTOR 1-like isoform X1 [Malus sylvestris]
MAMLVPSWLESLLSTAFFSICRWHKDGPRGECNMYCLDCNNGAFCSYCKSSRHKDHQVIQIRRSSYHDVVRVSEIQKVLDISGVQTYVINSARVLFLNQRPQPKTAVKGGSHICEICARCLWDPVRFCSLGCKLEGLKKKGEASYILSAKKEEEEGRKEGKQRRLPSEELLEDQLREGMQQEMYQSTPTPTPPPHSDARKRRRKGIPHRAPLRP